MPPSPKISKKAITLFSQFSLNGIDIIDKNHLPKDYPYVWISNAVRSDVDICKVMMEIAEQFPERQLSAVNISHLFSNEFAILIFYHNLQDFSRFADYLYRQYSISLRHDHSSKVADFPKSQLLRAAEQLESALLNV